MMAVGVKHWFAVGFLITHCLIQPLVAVGFTPNSPSANLYKPNCGVTEGLNALGKLNIFEEPPPSPKTKQNDSYAIFPDLVYEYKVAAIGDLSPIDFDYNQHVRRYIEIYSLERREQVAQMLGLAKLYFPMFEEMLDKYQLPLELKYLAVVESALNPLAISPSGAVGLWQFKLHAGRMFDLDVNSYIDQRMDPLLSTEAACQYLEYLYRIFKDWHLVMAAYNAGPGVVRNAIFRSGGETNFWKLRPILPEAAQNYVPAFIAAAYIMRNANMHGIEPIEPTITFDQTDTVQVSKPASFEIISAETGIPLNVLYFLNPTYRRGYIPKSADSRALTIPKTKVMQFLERENVIYETSRKTTSYHDVVASSGSTLNRVMVTHTVKAGEFLHMIAIRYGCTVDDIQIWNPRLGDELAIGQVLTIWTESSILQRLKQRNGVWP